MMIFSILKIGVAASAAFGLAALAWQIIRTLRFGGRRPLSTPSGSAAEGTIYAFGRGMLPWAKESAAKHLLTWTAGVLYHLALFFAFTELGFLLAGLLPPPGPAAVIRIVLAAGFLCGLGLLAKRIVTPALKGISSADDYISNLLADGLLLLAFLAMVLPWTAPLFFLWSIYLFLYMPFGKIRHCVFFFYTRILFGTFFGRRGVLPRRRREEA